MLAALRHHLLGPVNHESVSRDGHWSKVRKDWLLEHAFCAVCATRKFLTVHHKVPVSWDRTLELILSNLITLCETPSHNCHLLFGHLGDWKSRNVNVVEDCEKWAKKIENRPYRIAA